MRRDPFLWVCGIGVALAAVLCSAGHARLSPGQQAPNFTLRLHDTTQPVSLYDYAGEIIVLDFFAWWCGPCQTASSELEPYIQQYYAQRGGNPAGVPVRLMSICVSDQQDVETDQYISDYGLDLVLDDPNATVYYQYGTGSIPQFAIISGVQHSNYDPWEVLYMLTGYGSGYYLTFRNYINQVVPLLPGDANGDGKVNEADASILAAHWRQASGATWSQGDFNGDSRVDDLDASILAANWKAAGQPASVPDPSTAILVAGGLLALAAWYRLAKR